MRRRSLLSLALLVSALPALADPPMTNLKVEVTTQGGKPVERASVVVKFVEGRSILKLGKKITTNWETRTNQEGIAKLPPMPQGKILVQVIAKQYQTFGDVIEVNEPDRTVTVKLNPPQPQYSAH